MLVQIQNQQVREMLIEELAYVGGRAAAEVRGEIDAAGGDLEIDSKLGQTVAIRVAVRLDMEDLIRPEDQKRRNLTSVRSLEDLIIRRIAEHEPKED